MDLLDRVTRNSLRTLPDGLAELVGRHLAAAAAVLDDDPALAVAHSKEAARRAGRVAVVREAYGIASYCAGDYGRAITELKAAARIAGSNEYLPMIADCERGLGRPEKALAIASSAEASGLDREGKVEMLIVAAGARRDLGQVEAAVLTLQVPALRSHEHGEWLARLRYAYADALLAAGRKQDARRWFAMACDADVDGSTEAQERLDELDGLAFAAEIDDSGPDAEVAGSAMDDPEIRDSVKHGAPGTAAETSDQARAPEAGPPGRGRATRGEPGGSEEGRGPDGEPT